MTEKIDLEMLRVRGFDDAADTIEAQAAQIRVLREALEQAGHVVAYASHEDTVGYRVCCDVRSYEPHSKDCYLKSALEATK